VLDSVVYNLGLDRKELEYGVSERKTVPKPDVTDRATAAALVSAFASNAVHTSHSTWREAAAPSTEDRGDQLANVIGSQNPTGEARRRGRLSLA
jgi:hypothetical protein